MFMRSALLATAIAVVMPASLARASHDENKIARAILTPVTQEAEGASGEARYEIGKYWSSLHVGVLDLAAGDYTVRIGGVDRAMLTVGAIPGATAGEVEFRTFSNDPDVLPLDFDPVGQQVEIVDSMDVTQLSGMMGIPVDFELCDHEEFETLNLRVRMFPTDLAPFADGKIKFTSKKKKQDLKVELKFLPAGDYTLWVGGEEVHAFTVEKKVTHLRFSTKFGKKKAPLDFDPVNQDFEVRQGDDVYLFGILDRKDLGNKDFEQIEVDLVNTGEDPDASGEAEWTRIADASSFEVKVKNLDVGMYDLLVGGTIVGVIDVTENGAGGMTMGKIEFKTPMDHDHPPLTFDPRGMLIEVAQGGVVYLSATFPTVDDDDDDDGDDDDDDDVGDNDDDDDDFSGGIGWMR